MRYNFWKLFQIFWKYISLKLKFKTELKCYAHPAVTPETETLRQTGGTHASDGPTRQPVSARGGADGRDLAAGESSGDGEVTNVILTPTRTQWGLVGGQTSLA
jgi:hypothetical protein